MKVIFKDVVKRANTKEDRFNTEKIYYVGGEHIHSNELLINERGIIKGSTIGPMFYFGFKAGQVLFVTRNPHLRKAAMVEFDGICSEKTLVLETMNPSVLSQDYLPIIMQSDNFWHYCEEHKSGGVNYFINWSTLADYEFELPSLEEQHSHSQKIWAAYRLRESYKKLLAATDEMVKSQFIEMTTRSELNKKSIGEIAEVRTGSTPSRSNPEYWNGTHYWVSAQDMGNKYIYDTLEKITDKGYATCKVVPAGSILYVCRGSIGVMSINTMDCATNQSICTATCKKGYNTEYLYYALKVAEKTIKKQGIGTSFKSLNQSAFSSIEILFPAIEIQDKFAAIAKQADKSKFELKQCIENIDKVIKSLINR
ncbi:restriction endonuclease subunit S [Bacteroides fragilis]